MFLYTSLWKLDQMLLLRVFSFYGQDYFDASTFDMQVNLFCRTIELQAYILNLM